MTSKSLKKALTLFIEISNETFGSHYSLERTDFCYRVVTDEDCITKYRLEFLPSYLLSVANFSVYHGSIIIDFYLSDL